MIATGKVATMLLGSWAVPQMKDAAKAAGANPDDIAFWPFPYQAGGKFHSRIEGDYKGAVSQQLQEQGDRPGLAGLVRRRVRLRDRPAGRPDGDRAVRCPRR